jgi:predicted dithiol-disulfide oxidoreductase (DUF899 family)
MRSLVVAHQELLDAEKEFTRQRDALTRHPVAIPLERVENASAFERLMGMA